MENFFLHPPGERIQDSASSQLTLDEKIQKLINLCTAYKNKYDTMKIDYERTLTSNIELEDEKAQLLNEKHHLQQRIAQIDNDLQVKLQEINRLKEMNNELDSITHTAVNKIDKLLSECDFEV